MNRSQYANIVKRQTQECMTTQQETDNQDDLNNQDEKINLPVVGHVNTSNTTDNYVYQREGEVKKEENRCFAKKARKDHEPIADWLIQHLISSHCRR